MDCTRAQELTLDQLDGVTPGTQAREELHRHLAGCTACQGFAALQLRLDGALREGVPRVAAGAGFRRGLDARLPQPWPDWLPALAYVVGGVLATGACVLALPLPASSTWWIGGALAGGGLVSHTLVTSTLSRFADTAD